jgi:hypothetical protein
MAIACLREVGLRTGIASMLYTLSRSYLAQGMVVYKILVIRCIWEWQVRITTENMDAF